MLKLIKTNTLNSADLIHFFFPTLPLSSNLPSTDIIVIMYDSAQVAILHTQKSPLVLKVLFPAFSLVGSVSQRNRSVGPDSIFILANILTLLNQLIVKTCHFARKTWCLPLTGKYSPTTKPVELNTVPVLETRRTGGGGGVGYRLSGFFFLSLSPDRGSKAFD